MKRGKSWIQQIPKSSWRYGQLLGWVVTLSHATRTSHQGMNLRMCLYQGLCSWSLPRCVPVPMLVPMRMCQHLCPCPAPLPAVADISYDAMQ